MLAVNAPVLTYSFAIGQPQGFADLSSVRVLHDVVTDEGAAVEAGTRGTVVSVYADGAAYEVEFERGTATIEAAYLVAA